MIQSEKSFKWIKYDIFINKSNYDNNFIIFLF